MKKSCLFFLSFFLLGVVSCTSDKVILPSEQVSSKIIETEDKPIILDEANAIYHLGNLTSEGVYKLNVLGNVTAKKGFISYNQPVDNLIIKNKEMGYSKSVSSSFVKSEHEAYFTSKEVKYRNDLSNENYTLSSLEDYRNIYGVIPFQEVLGFIINPNTIVSSTKEPDENDRQVFKYVLDSSSSTVLIAKQMKEFGGLQTYPLFSSVVLQIFFTKDNELVQMKTSIDYQIDVVILGQMNCHQDLTYTFDLKEYSIELPK